MRWRAFPLLALALACSGCLGPRPPAPEAAHVTPPPDWRTATGPTAPLEADWWRAFGDPTLSATVDQALANNPDIAQAAARVAQARAAEHEARANRGPEIDFMNLGGYTRQLEVIGPITTSGDVVEGTAAWDLDFFHRLQQADAAARATLLGSEASQDAVRLSVASQAASDYISLLGADARLAIVRQNVESRRVALYFATRRFKAGYTSALELNQATAEYHATQQLVPQAELAVTQQEDALSILLGEPPRGIARRQDGLGALKPPPIPEGLPSSLLRRRPDVFAAEEAVVAADHSLNSARAAMLPDVSLTGMYEDIFASVLPHPEAQYLIAGSILAPVFDSGRRRAAAEGQAAQRDQAAFAYKSTLLTALREVDDSLAAVVRLDEQRTDLAAQAEAEARTLKTATERYREGYSPYFDQLDAERQLLSAQLSLAEAEVSRLNAYVSLYEAMGGGWRADARPRP